MANSLFDAGRESFLAGNTDWDANNIKLVFIDHADDTPVPSTDDNLDDLTAPARVATSGNFGSKTTTAGVADAADVTVTSVTGDPFESVVIYKDSGTEATSTLLVFIDTATGLPLTPDGGNVTVQWDSGANRIFKL